MRRLESWRTSQRFRVIPDGGPLLLQNLDFNSVCLKMTSFGLFEAMSAIEMMDPKMDAGLLSNQPKSKIKSFEQAIEVGHFFVLRIEIALIK